MAMDFFQAQEQARRKTRWLVLFFVLAVVLINLMLYFLFFMFFGAQDGRQLGAGAGFWQPDIFMYTLIGTCSVIAIGTIWKSWQLSRGGGAEVAQSLGGVPVRRDTQDLAQRRLLNVVDEMAIASGVAVPWVYILPEEQGINAFAAGLSSSDAVVAVTQGCLEKLNREELQGVIAHEFSHIFNGDMRLNLRLIGIIHGILLIAIIGRMLMSSSRRSSGSKNSGGGNIFIGLMLFIIGYIGVFFGNLIKAAVSRQREFLADASAVQYSRNPQGLSSALQKIAGVKSSELHHPRAEEVSHMFFGQGISNWFGLFATHPPVKERILRLDPSLRAFLEEAEAEQTSRAFGDANTMGVAAGQISPAALRQSLGTVNAAQLAFARQFLGMMDASLRELLDVPIHAKRLIYALLVQETSASRAELAKALGPGREEDIEATLELVPRVQQLGRALWLPILDLALPALRELPTANRASLLKETEALVMADAKVNFFEFALMSLLEQQLAPKAKPRLRRYEPDRIREDCAYLLSFMAMAGQRQVDEVRAAFQKATKSLAMVGNFRLYAAKDIAFKRLKDCLERLNGLNPRFKAQLIEALMLAITADGRVTQVEFELLRAIGARLECPVPMLRVGQILSEAS
jgi:Zn-dependent protease with chaperone function